MPRVVAMESSRGSEGPRGVEGVAGRKKTRPRSRPSRCRKSGSTRPPAALSGISSAVVYVDLVVSKSVQRVQIPHSKAPPCKQADLGLHVSYHVHGLVVDDLELRRLLYLPSLVPFSALLCLALPPFLAVGFHQLELRHNRSHAEDDFCRHLCHGLGSDTYRRLAPFLRVQVMPGLLFVEKLDVAMGLVDGRLEFGNVVLEGFGLPASADARHISTDASGYTLQNLPSGLDQQWPTHHTIGTWREQNDLDNGLLHFVPKHVPVMALCKTTKGCPGSWS
ncbi:uncharacterized protein IWZ02DRAFT_160168 [Phyllosticta citriasiana]|uniref:Uncharacterized protein n=1 Tax=Phyllosticta citriasiana TaxID=595635 RepID=A0ABR1KWC1_9PEZI